MAVRGSRLVFILVLLAAIPSALLLAQTSPGTLRGTVVDKDGQPLPGATVVLENPGLGFNQMGGVTNPSGEFRLTPIPPGKGYILRVSMPNFQKIEFTLEIYAGKTVVQNVTLRPELKTVVRVEGKEEAVKTDEATISTSITSEFISGLPVLGTDYQDVLTLAPGVTDVNNTGNPNIHGARSSDVVTLVDGVSTTDPFNGNFGQNLNTESIEEIEVITSGATAEYSRAQGGFVNIVTKSGGNEFKGTFKFAMRTNKLDGDGAGIDQTELRGGVGESDGFRDLAFTDLYPYLSVSGAFVKDHLWYYFAPEYIQVENPVNTGTQAFVQTTTDFRITGKVTWQITSNNKLAFIGIYDEQQNDNLGLDSFTQIESGFTFQRGGPTLTLQDTWLFSPTVSLESTISRFDQTFEQIPTTHPDTNGNGFLTIDHRADLGGNLDGFINLRERDPGDDFDGDGKYDVYEDSIKNGHLDGCTPLEGGGQTCLEDRDKDGRLSGPYGCEGSDREDFNCNGRLDSEIDTNENGQLDPEEDTGIPCDLPRYCPFGIIPGTDNNNIRDTEDRNGNNNLDDTPFRNWVDSNNNGIAEFAEYQHPLAPDKQNVLSFNTNRTSGPYNFTYGDSRTRDSLKEDLSYYIDDLFGSHELKGGLSYEQEGYSASFSQRPFWQIETGGTDLGTGQIGGVIDAFVPTQEDAKNSASSTNYGFYFQDTYKPLSNLTVNLGVRFDREEVSSHGYEFFDPVQQRIEYDALMGLKGVESNGDDLNADGILTATLARDPLYGASNVDETDPNRVNTLGSNLATAAFKRFTRHNFQTSIDSVKLKELGVDDPSLLGTGRPRAPQDFTITNNNLAPRISLSWDPWGDGKSKATAGWGRFYDKLFLATVIGEEGPDLINPYYGYDSDGVDSNGLPDNKVGRVISSPPPSATQVERGLRTPFTDEFTIGFQREIAPEMTVSINYIQRDFRDQLQDIDVNHSFRRPPFCDKGVTVDGYCDGFGRTQVRPPQGGSSDTANGPDERHPDQYPDLFINNLNFNQILRVGNFNVQSYVGYELQFVRRLSRRWQMDASYVFSKARGQAEAFADEAGNDPALTELRNGYLAFDQRHVGKFHAISFLPGDWQLGGGVTWSSGLPYSNINRVRSADNVDFPQTRRVFGSHDVNTGYFYPEQRNSHRNHAIYNIDIRTEKKFVIGQVTAGAFFEIFNLLNQDNLRVFTIDDRFFTLESNQVRDFGRRFQLGIKMDF